MFKNLPPLDSALVEALYSAPPGIVAICDGNFPVYSYGQADQVVRVQGKLEYAVKAVRDTRQIVRYSRSEIGVWMEGGSAAEMGSGVDLAVKMALQPEFGPPHLQNFGTIKFTEFCENVRAQAAFVIQVVDETAWRSSLLLRIDRSLEKFPENLSPQMVEYAYKAGEGDPLVVVGASHSLVTADLKNPVIQTHCDSIEPVAKDLSEVWECATDETGGFGFTSETDPESIVAATTLRWPRSRPTMVTDQGLKAILNRSPRIPIFVVGSSNRCFVFYKGHTISSGFRG